MRRFARGFAAIWGLHDLLDLIFGGSTPLTLGPLPAALRLLRLSILLTLLGAQAGLLLWRLPRAMAALAWLARGLQAVLTPLNDYTYGCAMLLFCGLAPRPPAPLWGQSLHRLLLWQTAWIYAATGLLKLSPHWLSGGHLWVRQMHLLCHAGWPYPALLRPCITSLACTQRLALLGVGTELLLAALLAQIAWQPRGRRWRGAVAVALAAGLHLGAALSVDVFFFGASMVWQVACVVWQQDGAPRGSVVGVGEAAHRLQVGGAEHVQP